jgi:hypothetical protein
MDVVEGCCATEHAAVAVHASNTSHGLRASMQSLAYWFGCSDTEKLFDVALVRAPIRPQTRTAHRALAMRLRSDERAARAVWRGRAPATRRACPLVYAGHSRSHLNVFPRGSRPLGISRIAQRSVSTCTSEVDEAPCCRDERAQHNHAPLDATSSAPCAMAHFRADPSERPAHALATANPTAALLIRAAAGRRGDRELARDGGPRRALPHVARPSVGTAPAATARSMAARATPMVCCVSR